MSSSSVLSFFLSFFPPSFLPFSFPSFHPSSYYGAGPNLKNPLLKTTFDNWTHESKKNGAQYIISFLARKNQAIELTILPASDVSLFTFVCFQFETTAKYDGYSQNLLRL